MKKYLLLIIYLFSLFTFSSAQNPLMKQWDYRFGGTGGDLFSCFQQTSDGGYILGGYSNSDSSGDKSQNKWGYSDYWIVKIDSLGIKQWDKDFGGIGQDYLFTIQQTTDGGYILGGGSYSDSSGDKTQNNWDATLQSADYWIIKTDSLGNKQWDKVFGGTNLDILHSLQQTNDGGYILGGFSYSGISGDKTQGIWSIDTADYWIVKIDSLGNKQWDKDFGGTDEDELYSLQQTSDGGYILGGHSLSGIGGDKTQPNWDPGGNTQDYWIIKTNSLGNKLWDRNFGGTDIDALFSLKQTVDGGFILAGHSWSWTGGDKTQDPWGETDYWILKTDSLGIKQWDKDYGGTKTEELFFGNIFLTSDGGYLITGTSYSNIGGDKTEDNLGPEQTWAIKIDSNGIKQWDKTLRTNTIYDDEVGFGVQTKDGCFAIANCTYADIGGDKTQPNWGSTDYWIIKFCDTTVTTTISNIQPPASNFYISPNPFNESVIISSESREINNYEIKIKDIEGRVLLHTPNSQLPIKLGLSFLSKGIYLLEINIDDERTVKKIVKQ